MGRAQAACLKRLGEGASTGTSRSPARGQIPVVVAPVRTGSVTGRVESVGTVGPREAVTITTRVAGIVTAVRFTKGQNIREGDVRLGLDSAAIRAEIDQARAQQDNALTQPARARALPARPWRRPAWMRWRHSPAALTDRHGAADWADGEEPASRSGTRQSAAGPRALGDGCGAGGPGGAASPPLPS